MGLYRLYSCWRLFFFFGEGEEEAGGKWRKRWRLRQCYFSYTSARHSTGVLPFQDHMSLISLHFFLYFYFSLFFLYTHIYIMHSSFFFFFFFSPHFFFRRREM